MKKLGFRFLVLVFVGLMAGAAWAQPMGQILTVDIPFDFVIGNASLPAGSYEVTGSWGSRILWFRDQNTGKTAVLTAIIPDANNNYPRKSVLQFHRYGDTYFLSKIVLEGNSTSQVVTQSKREREVALAAARAGRGPVQSAEVLAK